MKTKITVLILSIIYCSYLLTLLAASHYKSSTLNPLDSEYYYQNKSFAKAIEVEPTKAQYHMYYALELLKSLPEDRISAQTQLRLAKSEFYRAAKLKPYNAVYQKTYNIYAAWIAEQL